MNKSTIKIGVVRFLESQGPKSKSKIEDYIRLELGTNGDTTSRRMRELVASGVLKKVQREHEGKKYWEYSVCELEVTFNDTSSQEMQQLQTLNL